MVLNDGDLSVRGRTRSGAGALHRLGEGVARRLMDKLVDDNELAADSLPSEEEAEEGNPSSGDEGGGGGGEGGGARVGRRTRSRSSSSLQ